MQYLGCMEGILVLLEVSADRGTTWTTVYGPMLGAIDLAWTEKVVVLSEACTRCPGSGCGSATTATMPGRRLGGTSTTWV